LNDAKSNMDKDGLHKGSDMLFNTLLKGNCLKSCGWVRFWLENEAKANKDAGKSNTCYDIATLGEQISCK